MLATFDAVIEALEVPAVIPWRKITPNTNGDLISLWRQGDLPAAGAVPPTGSGEAPTSATLGALPFTNAAAKLYLAGLKAGVASNNEFGFLLLYDRLVHTSGLVLNVTTPQTVNSAALTRHTGGAGVLAFIESYTTGGLTVASLTASYTNQDGTAGRTAEARTVNSANFDAAGMRVLPLQSGDTGVRSVESVTLDVSTGSAGNFGITLMRPVALLGPLWMGLDMDRDWLDCALAEIEDDACLAITAGINNTVATAHGHLLTMEG